MFTSAINSVKEILSKEIMRLNQKVEDLHIQNMNLKRELEEKELQLNVFRSLHESGAKPMVKIGEDGQSEYWCWELQSKEEKTTNFEKDIHYP